MSTHTQLQPTGLPAAAGRATLAAAAGAGSFGFVFTVLLGRPDVLVTLAVLGVISALLARPVARRLEQSAALVLVALCSLAVVPALTLVPDLGYSEYLRTPWLLERVPLFLGSGWSRLFTGWASGTDGPLNVLLYTPCGLLLTLVLRRPGRIAAGLVLLSLTTEVLQSWSGTRSGSPGDIGANTIGACIGVSAAVLLLQQLSLPRSDTTHRGPR